MLESARQEKRAFAGGGFNAPVTAPVQMPVFDTSKLEEEMRLTRQAIKDQQVLFDFHYFKREDAKYVQLQNNTKG